MALRDIRLRPYVWSVRQALLWGAVAGALCAVPLWLIGWPPSIAAGGGPAGFLGTASGGAVVTSALAACTALFRNLVTGLFYQRQKLERLARARWSPWELAFAGAIVFGAAALIFGPAAPGLIGTTLSGPQVAAFAFLSAGTGALFMPLVGLLRSLSLAREPF